MASLFVLPLVSVDICMAQEGNIGREVAIARHLQDGQEFDLSIRKLIAFGEKLFRARWTIQEGAGRPLSKGTGAALSDLTDPLVFPQFQPPVRPGHQFLRGLP